MTTRESEVKKEMRDFYAILFTGCTLFFVIYGFMISLIDISNMTLELQIVTITFFGFIAATPVTTLIKYKENMSNPASKLAAKSAGRFFFEMFLAGFVFLFIAFRGLSCVIIFYFGGYIVSHVIRYLTSEKS